MCMYRSIDAGLRCCYRVVYKAVVLWALSQYKDCLSQVWGIPMLKIRRSRDRLIFNMGIPMLVRHLYIESAPWLCGLYLRNHGDLIWVQFQYKDWLSRYRDAHYEDKMVMRPSYLYNGNSYTRRWHLYIETTPCSVMC